VKRPLGPWPITTPTPTTPTASLSHSTILPADADVEFAGRRQRRLVLTVQRPLPSIHWQPFLFFLGTGGPYSSSSAPAPHSSSSAPAAPSLLPRCRPLPLLPRHRRPLLFFLAAGPFLFFLGTNGPFTSSPAGLFLIFLGTNGPFTSSAAGLFLFFLGTNGPFTSSAAGLFLFFLGTNAASSRPSASCRPLRRVLLRVLDLALPPLWKCFQALASGNAAWRC